MKRHCKMFGLIIMAAGGMILVSCFLPPGALIVILSILLILTGLLCFTA